MQIKRNIYSLPLETADTSAVAMEKSMSGYSHNTILILFLTAGNSRCQCCHYGEIDEWIFPQYNSYSLLLEIVDASAVTMEKSMSGYFHNTIIIPHCWNQLILVLSLWRNR